MIDNAAPDSVRQVVFEAAALAEGSELGLSRATLVIVDDDSGQPGEPTGLVALPADRGAVQLSWQPPGKQGGARVSGYRVEASDDGENWYVLRVNTASRKTVWSDATLTPGESRNYRVSAINSYGVGEPSVATTGAAKQ